MGKILAIDYGRKRVGLALSDEEHIFAFTLTAVTGKDKSCIEKLVLRKIQELEPEIIVIGVPLGLDLKPTQMSLEVEEFIKFIDNNSTADIVKWNEVGTSKLAQKNLRISKKRDIDSESARIILQEYLDFKREK